MQRLGDIGGFSGPCQSTGMEIFLQIDLELDGTGDLTAVSEYGVDSGEWT